MSTIGHVGGIPKDQVGGPPKPTFCIARSFVVGSRQHFEDMNWLIEVNKIKLMLDKRVFKFEDLKDAYQYMWGSEAFLEK